MSGRYGRPLGVVAMMVALCVPMLLPVPGYLGTKSILSAITHHFFHANWFHLAANSLAIWLAFSRSRGMSEMLTGWVLASLSYTAAISPCIGFSDILFAVAGLRAATYGRTYWVQPSTLMFIATMIAMCFLPQFSATTHITAFVLGLLWSVLSRTLKRIRKDYEAVSRR